MDGTAGAKLGSFVVKAGSSEGVTVTSVALSVNEEVVATAAATHVTNLKLMKETATGDVQLGTTQSSVLDTSTISFSVSGFALGASEQAVLNVYGDLGSALSTNTVQVSVTASGISGSATQSTTAISAPTAALALQLITGSAGGTLRVTLAGDSPTANQLVAGTSNNDVLKVKLAASLAEDIYLKEVTVRVDNTLDDVAVGSLSLYNASVTPAVSLGTLSYQQDTTYPGYVTWTFTGTARPKVPSNGALYLMVKMNVVSSQQGTITNLTPVLSVASVKAEGVSQISPLFISTGNSTDSLVDTANDSDSGCNVTADEIAGVAGATDTIAVDSCATDKLAVGMVIHVGAEGMLITAIATPGATPTLTVTRLVTGTTATPVATSNILYGGIDDSTDNNVIVVETDGGAFDATANGFAVGQVTRIGTEDMYVMAVAANTLSTAHQTVTVTRAVNNTTVAAALKNVAVNEYTAVTGNAMLAVNTKPTITVAADSPSGAKSAGTTQVLAKFTVAADANAADTAENAVTLSQFDVRLSRTGVNVANLAMYPASADQNATHIVNPAFWVSGNTARFNVVSNASLVAADYNRIIEGTNKSFVLRGDITATAQGGNLTVELGNLGTSASVSLGAGDAGGDVQWTDGSNTFYWVSQGVATTVALNPAAMTYGSASGTLDTTRPVISSIRVDNGTGANQTANSIDSDIVCTGTSTAPTLVCDHATVIFSEAIDPTTITAVANLVPAGTVSGSAATTTITSPVAIQLVGLTSIITGSTGGSLITFVGIGNVTATVAAADFLNGDLAPWVALDATGTTLKIYNIDNAADRAIGALSVSAGIGTIVKDLNGNFLNTTAPAATAGQF